MAEFTVKQGRQYRAEIALGFFERMVSNETLESILREKGFADVRASGSGAIRYVEALWPSPDTTAMMPPQIASIAELPDPESEAFRA